MNGASFWAQKRSVVKSPESPKSPPLVITEPSKPTPSSFTKPKLTLKGVAKKPATDSTTTTKKVSWADSDEDEEFATAFPANKLSLRLKSLESEMIEKNLRLEELEAILLIRGTRISELEDTVQEKDDRISHLEVRVEKQAKKVDGLTKENHQHSLRVQELVAEVDEKDRRIYKLERDLEERAAIIRSLEAESDSQTAVSSELTDIQDTSSIKPIRSEAVDLAGVIDHPVKGKAGERVTLLDPADTSSDDTSQNASCLTKRTAKTVSKSSTACSTGPRFRESNFPIFVTPETLKIVPPAPMPKKMSFPMDLSRYKRNACLTPATEQNKALEGETSLLSTAI